MTGLRWQASRTKSDTVCRFSAALCSISSRSSSVNRIRSSSVRCFLPPCIRFTLFHIYTLWAVCVFSGVSIPPLHKPPQNACMSVSGFCKPFKRSYSIPQKLVFYPEQLVLLCCELVSFTPPRSEPPHRFCILSPANVCRALWAIFQANICKVICISFTGNNCAALCAPFHAVHFPALPISAPYLSPFISLRPHISAPSVSSGELLHTVAAAVPSIIAARIRIRSIIS